MTSTLTTLLEKNTDLTTLAGEINAEHAATLTAARTTLEHARRAGELLNEAKSMLGHGKWLPWLKANVSFSPPTAQRYMRVASRWDELANTSPMTHLTEATALLAEPKPDAEPVSNNWRPFHELPQEDRADLCQKWWDIQASRTVLYHAAGWSVAQIVDLVQAPEHEVNGVLTPRVKILYGEPGAKLFDDERGEDRYRQVVDAHLHHILSSVYRSASWAAERDGFPELATPLKSIWDLHERQANSLPRWLFVDCSEPHFETAVNTLAFSDCRKALGFIVPPEDTLVFRMATLMNAIDDIGNHMDDEEIDWVALERSTRIRQAAVEHNFNPATFRAWDADCADRQQSGGAT